MIPANFKVYKRETREWAHVAAMREGAYGMEFYVAVWGYRYQWQNASFYIYQS